MTKPLNKFQAGNIDTAIWENEIEINGKKINTKSISLRKSWKVGEEWKDSTIHLQINELQRAILVLQEAQKDVLIKNGNGQEMFSTIEDVRL